MKRLLSHLILPKEISAFEEAYLRNINKKALGFFAFHVPVLVVVAWGNGTKPWLAACLGLAALVGPAIAYKALQNPRAVSIVYGVAAMFFGGLLVHFGQGPMQIEMHFYFFALIAILSVFGNPLVIIAAAVTVALHHLVLWFLLPSSVFNYEAPIWVVLVHAAFVVLESAAACFIARSFFDNVIGLERIVRARTSELDTRNADMRLVLDNVGQALVTVDRSGMLSRERSRAFADWFGPHCASLYEACAVLSVDFAERTRVAWEALIDDVLPLEVHLEQMPKMWTDGKRQLAVSYLPIGDGPSPARFLLVVTDVSAQIAQERSERERAETMQLFERSLSDRGAVTDFFDEVNELVGDITRGADDDIAVLKRKIHTVKGNTALFGIHSVSTACHDLETFMREEGVRPPTMMLASLGQQWRTVASKLEGMLGTRVIELTPHEHEALECDARHVSRAWAQRIHELKLQKTRQRLMHFAEQARRIASGLEKEIEVEIEDNGMRLDTRRWAPLWSAFVHAVRNAVDHGIEMPDERARAGKSRRGRIRLSTSRADDRFVLTIADDGRGIDWDALRRKALGRTDPATTGSQDEIFVDGVSTASAVTDLSGRGIGMGALLQTTRSLGGTVAIESPAGQGTTIRLSFAIDETAPDLANAA